MNPESHWNQPLTTLEENRTSQWLTHFSHLNELWDSIYNGGFKSSLKETWESIYHFQEDSLKQFLARQSSREEAFNRIQSAAWQYGKLLSEKDWPQPVIQNPFEAYLALSLLKVGALEHSDSFILERKTEKICTFYWLSSPIESAELCQVYHEFFRGFTYHLSRNLRLDIHPSILPSSNEKLKSWKFTLLWID